MSKWKKIWDKKDRINKIVLEVLIKDDNFDKYINSKSRFNVVIEN